MPSREITLTDVTKQADLLRLRTYLRELYTIADPRYSALAFSSTLSMDASITQSFFVLLTGNVTSIAIINPAPGRTLLLTFLQDGTGSRTIGGWPANVKFAGGAFTPTSTANKYSTLSLEYINGFWIEIVRTLNVG